MEEGNAKFKAQIMWSEEQWQVSELDFLNFFLRY